MKPANIYIEHASNKGIYLHTMERGNEIPVIIHRALNRSTGFWNDSAAMTRIVFAELVQGELLGNKGYGISPFIQENYQFITVLSPIRNKIGFFFENGSLIKSYGLAEYASKREHDVCWSYLIDRPYRPVIGADFNNVTYRF